MEVKQQVTFIPFTFIYSNCYEESRKLWQTFLVDLVAGGLPCYQNKFHNNIFSEKKLKSLGLSKKLFSIKKSKILLHHLKGNL